MWRHLAEYKAATLGVGENGIWKKNNTEYPHILPVNLREMNILEPYRDEFWKWFQGERISLHSDFHHLSSSQAMCFNLFFPFLADNGRHLQMLRDLFLIEGHVRRGEFEVVLDEVEGTNFDFCIYADAQVLLEVKLTESRFGSAGVRESLLKKFDRVYSPLIAGKFKPECCSFDVFMRNYQIMRNVWNLAPGNNDALVFLVPKANRSLAAGLAFVDFCLSDEYRSRVSVLYLEEIISKIEQLIPSAEGRMREHFMLFRLKYLPESPA